LNALIVIALLPLAISAAKYLRLRVNVAIT